MAYQLTEYAKAQIQGRDTFPGEIQGFNFDLCKISQPHMEKLYKLSGGNSRWVEPAPQPEPEKPAPKETPAPAAAKKAAKKE